MSDASEPGNDLEYWGGSAADDLPDLMLRRIADYWEYVESTGRAEIWSRSNQLYYGQDADGGYNNSAAVTAGGDEGEETNLRINHFRSLLVHVIALTTATRPSMEARAINADAESMRQRRLADGLLDFYMTEQQLERKAVSAMEYTVRFAEASMLMKWDKSAGDLMEDGTHTGDVAVKRFQPRDIIRDPAHDGVHDHRWYIVHDRRSRWDLVAEFATHADFSHTPDPDEAREEMKDAILSAASTPDVALAHEWNRWKSASRDEVSVFELYHSKTPALPEGRFSIMVGDTLLWDGPLPYESNPVLMVADDEELDTPNGYSTSWDLMAPQAGIDSCVSTMLSNHTAFGKQHVWTEKGSGLTVEDMGKGLTHWEANSRPEAIQLTKTSEHSYKLLELLQEAMQKIRGVGDVARGDSTGVKSGAMAALMHSMASQYNNPLQRAYGDLLSRMGTMLVQILQQYATTPRVIDIMGTRNRPLVKEFTGDQISKVRRVVVDIGNASMRTHAGRQHIADTLLERGAIDAAQYLEVVSTGRLEPITERHETVRRGIASENEMLMDGAPPPIMVTDDHPLHIREHLTLLDEPNIRTDNDVSAIVLDHIQSHLEIWQTVPADMLAALNIPPPPPPPAPPMPPGAPMPAGNPDMMGQGAPPEAGPPPAEFGDDDQQASLPDLPSLPNEGATYDPNQGAMQ